MTNANKRKGDTFEIALRNHLDAAGFDVDRTRAGYARDHGDLHVARTLAGPRVIVQAKNHARLSLSEWLTGLAAQLADSAARHGVLVVKRRGVGDPGRSYAVVELDAYLALLREAGYAARPAAAPVLDEAA